MTNDATAHQDLLLLLENLRTNSMHALTTFLGCVALDGVPATLIINRPLKPGGPVEIACLDNLDIRPGQLYSKSK